MVIMTLSSFSTIKGIVREGILQRAPVARVIVNLALRLHNRAYQLAGKYSAHLEPDGLHPKHRLMKYHLWFMSRVQPEWRVLDIGCGIGALAHDLKTKCRTLTGIDLKGSNIVEATRRYAAEGLSFHEADALTYQVKEPYDAFILSNVLEHIQNRVDFLKDLYANYPWKPKPIMLLRVPMLTRDWITLYKKERGEEWRLDLTHAVEYTEEFLRAELTQAGLQIVEWEIRFGESYIVASEAPLPRPVKIP
jgi:cyclopropane fatty-acyl-phospholipid synthase-like methyltransferase